MESRNVRNHASSHDFSLTIESIQNYALYPANGFRMSVRHRVSPMPFQVLPSLHGSHRFPLTAYKLAEE